MNHLETVKKCIEQLKRTDAGALAEVIDSHLDAAIAEGIEPYKKAAEALTNGLAAIEELFTAEPTFVLRPTLARHRITNGDQDRIDSAFHKSKLAASDYRMMAAPKPILQIVDAPNPRAIAAERDAPLSPEERRW